jgi:septum formation protein
MQLVLASSSKSRLALLKQVLIEPNLIISPDVNEIPLKGEKARELTRRLALEKLLEAAKTINLKSVVIAADSSAEQGASILGKANSQDDVRAKMQMLSGRKHRLYTSVAVGLVENGKLLKKSLKTNKNIITFKSLTSLEIDQYVSSNQGIGCEGGLMIEGLAGAFVRSIDGSPSGIMGLPLYETLNMIHSMGYTRHF